MAILTRLAIVFGAMIATGTITVIALALYDMDRAGHGRASFVQTPLDFPGSQMSVGDAVLLVAVAASGLIAWWIGGRS